MSKPRVYYRWQIPTSVVEIVRAVCADYDRRRVALRRDDLPDGVRDMYAKLNKAVEDALADVEEGIKAHILNDIGKRRGYDYSSAMPYLAKNTYYHRKHKVVHDVAVALALI